MITRGSNDLVPGFWGLSVSLRRTVVSVLQGLQERIAGTLVRAQKTAQCSAQIEMRRLV
jgi:hypothetical protein